MNLAADKNLASGNTTDQVVPAIVAIVLFALLVLGIFCYKRYKWKGGSNPAQGPKGHRGDGNTVFISWRMAECKPEVKSLVAALEDCGVQVIVIKEAPGGDLLQAVSNGMDQADLYVIMGTKTYGRVTSGVIDTYKEMQLIQSSKKPYFLINMNPEDSLMKFEEPATNLVFNLTTVAWERWEVSRPRMKPLDPKIIFHIVAKLRAAGAAGAGATDNPILVDSKHGWPARLSFASPSELAAPKQAKTTV
jgi:hypothetical protein